MERPIDDKVLALLDDYWEALQADDTKAGLTTRSRPAESDPSTDGIFQLLEQLADARRILQDDTRYTPNEGPILLDEPPTLPEQFGRYRIERQLGKGGMGAVFLVYDTQLQRDVALKVPHFSRADDPEVRERFLREARAAATLNHANICPVYDIGEIEGVLYLTMAFIDGEPLTCRAVGLEPAMGAQEGDESPLAAPPASPLTSRYRDRDAAALICKVALALDHAHGRGVVHRDLKPGNIMLDRRGEPIVVDFGLARRMEVQDATLTRRGMILGSLAYMSPEQALGEHERVGLASDIYSLGVIFYELLTGQLPYEGRRSSVLGRIVSPAPVNLAHRSDLNPDLRAICAKALAKRVEERFASMAEFAAALQDYLKGAGETSGVYAAPASFVSRLRVGINFGAVLLLAMFGVALGGLVVIKLQTADGTLVVEVNEPGAKVSVLNERGEVEITRASDWGTLKLSVDPGKHRLKVEKDGFAVFAKEFSIASGETGSIKATLVPPQPVVSAASRPDNQGPIPAPPGLVAWWSGDGHARDFAGTNDGLLTNGASFAPGLVGQAFQLDGVDDYVQVLNNPALNFESQLSIEFWICPDQIDRWQNVVSKWNGVENDWSYGLQQSYLSNQLRFYLCTTKHEDLASIHARSPIAAGVWTHACATFDGNRSRLYINGVLETNEPTKPERPIRSSATDLLIGASIGNRGRDCHFSGLIDELSLYNRALDESEVQAIYRAGSAGKIKPGAHYADRAASKRGTQARAEKIVAIRNES